MTIQQAAVRLIEKRFHDLKNNSGHVVNVSPSGECTGYGSPVEDLDRNHYRQHLFQFCVGAKSSILPGEPFIVFRLENGDMKIVPMDEFRLHLPFDDYKSPIPA